MNSANTRVPFKPSPPDKQARERLLESGLDEFGEHGLQAATTRGIARRAKVNIALISYYFESKEGLYHAVVEQLAERIQSAVQTTLQEIEDLGAASSASRQEALTLLLKLIGNMADLMLGSAPAPRFARIILREQMHPSGAYDIIYNRVMQPLIEAIAKMLALAAGRTPTPEMLLRAMAMIGQIMVFRVARETLLRLRPGMQGYSPDETDQIRRIILEQIESVVEGLGKE